MYYKLLHREHMKWLRMKYSRQSKREKWVQNEHMRTFTYWLQEKVLKCL